MKIRIMRVGRVSGMRRRVIDSGGEEGGEILYPGGGRGHLYILQ